MPGKSVSFLFIFLLYLIAINQVSGQIDFNFNSSYSYLKGSAASDIPDEWNTTGFDASAWSMSAAPFRYGDGTGGTVLDDMQNNYSTVYLRSSFIAQNIKNIKELTILVNYDDGFILWVNGAIVLQKNAPDLPAYNAFASGNHESGIAETYVIDSSEIQLVEGDNIIAVQCFNVLANSSDFYFDLSINASLSLPPFPDSTHVLFNKEAGFYTDPFKLELSTPPGDYKIIYTVDCSNPQKIPVTQAETDPVQFEVAPQDTLRSAKTPVFTVRASLVKDGYAPSFPFTKSYIFLDEVKSQGYPGGEWPDSWVNDQVIDLAAASDVVNDPRYSSDFNSAMKQIPSIVVSTDIDNLFDGGSGIYVNAKEHGKDWERDCSVEFINPGGSDMISVNAGIRIRGGNSRNGGNPKHAFRLFFREEYGNPKLEYTVFGNEGVSEYDKLDLRTAQNYSWSMDGSSHNTFLRDIFSRDLQRDLGRPYTRGNYAHLYLNGMYWGLFQTEERPEARYAESYFGDDKDDYDVIKVAVEAWPYYNEVTDGNMEAWEKLWELCEKGFSSNEDYFALEGKDKNGKPLKNSKVLVDIDNLIDYMLIIFYTGNIDAPVSAWYENKMPNNYYAIYNRKDKGKGFVFIAHDSEHCMFVDPIYVNDGLYENRVEIDDPEMDASGVESFQPQWLHQKLMENEEYRIRFADRAFMHIERNGPLSVDKCLERMQNRMDEIDMAIICESARWGDAKTNPSLNKNDDWLPEVESILQDFIPYRTDILVNQLKDAGIYQQLEPPASYLDGSETTASFIQVNNNGVQLKLVNQNSSGNIYYTLDGTDPRNIGGQPGLQATDAGSECNFTVSASKVITARVYDEGAWSAKIKLTMALENEDYSMLRITELHYHPSDRIDGVDTTSGKDQEFIELKNTGEDAIDLSGIRIDSAVQYTIPDKTVLPPGKFYVIASRPETFYATYGMYPDGNFDGHFSNSGEKVTVYDPENNEILAFTYDDHSPWPEAADGAGYSLVPYDVSATGDPDDPSYWRSSLVIGGSPYSDDVLTPVEEYNYESFSWEDVQIYPNPASDIMHINFNNQKNIDDLQLELTDIRGRILYANQIKGNTVLSLREIGLQPGIYFISLQTGNSRQTFKILYQPN